MAADVLFAKFQEEARHLVEKGEIDLEFTDNLWLIMPASLLYGLAPENMFKALILDRGDSLKFTHDLCELARLAVFELTDEEIELAKRLSAFVVWSGKYPIAKSAREMILKQKMTNGDSTPMPLQQHESSLFGEMFARAEAIIFR